MACMAWCNSCLDFSTCGSSSAMPTLALIWILCSLMLKGADKLFKILSAIVTNSFKSSCCVNIIANSSPEKCEITPWFSTALEMRFATAISNWSPITWPKLWFKGWKSSRSTYITINDCWLVCFLLKAISNTSSKARWLIKPVRLLWVCWCAIYSVLARCWVISCWIPKKCLQRCFSSNTGPMIILFQNQLPSLR